MIEKTMEVDRMEDVISVFGSFDQNLRMIETEYNVRVTDRDEQIHITGEAENVLYAEKAIAGLLSLTVNGLDYRLKPNTLINLGPFHRYRYLPDDGEVLEIAESRMNSGTYVYLVANPYMKFERFYVPSEPPVVALSGLYAEIANDAMNGILTETEKQSPDQLQLCFCYMMDLLGILTEKMPRTYFRQTLESSKD